jgi:hypothetical protein
VKGKYNMSLGIIRDFVVVLIEKIDSEGILGEGYSNTERAEDVIKMIWDTYEKFIK